ncbi:hypothetical protein [Streptomyces platensis]|nr:hypothetical protein [Streptomyces platensis]WUB80613.1 hypothetical protein OG424_16335 [Streptomyces platensis]
MPDTARGGRPWPVASMNCKADAERLKSTDVAQAYAESGNLEKK